MRFFVRHLASVILVMVLDIDANNNSCIPQYNLGSANNALISAYNSDYINQAYNVVETIPTRFSIKALVTPLLVIE